jgi:hypothetical protein
MSIYRKLRPGALNDVYGTGVGPEVEKPEATTTSEDSEQAKRRRGEPMNAPLPRTFPWIAKLPRDVQPVELLRAYPRIANVIASIWGEPAAMTGYLDELLHDRRGNRKGFPPAVMAELLALRTHYRGLHPEPSISRGDIDRRR